MLGANVMLGGVLSAPRWPSLYWPAVGLRELLGKKWVLVRLADPLPPPQATHLLQASMFNFFSLIFLV